jgi:hypothetical protein
MVDTQNKLTQAEISLSFIRKVPSSNDGLNTEWPDFGVSRIPPYIFRYINVNVGYTAGLAHPYKFVTY